MGKQRIKPEQIGNQSVPRTDTRAPLRPVTTVNCQGVRENSYRLETQYRLGGNQTLSLTGYESKIRQTVQRTKLHSEHS